MVIMTALVFALLMATLALGCKHAAKLPAPTPTAVRAGHAVGEVSAVATASQEAEKRVGAALVEGTTTVDVQGAQPRSIETSALSGLARGVAALFGPPKEALKPDEWKAPEPLVEAATVEHAKLTAAIALRDAEIGALMKEHTDLQVKLAAVTKAETAARDELAAFRKEYATMTKMIDRLWFVGFVVALVGVVYGGWNLVKGYVVPASRILFWVRGGLGVGAALVWTAWWWASGKEFLMVCVLAQSVAAVITMVAYLWTREQAAVVAASTEAVRKTAALAQLETLAAMSPEERLALGDLALTTPVDDTLRAVQGPKVTNLVKAFKALFNI
jgi:hypothetical protein